MVSGVGGNGNNIPKNNYGIDQKELQQLKQEAQKANIDFNQDGKVDAKDQQLLQEAIQSNNLGAFLDQLGNDIKGVMGLHLTNKVDGAEKLAQAQTIEELQHMVDSMNLEPGTDKARVIDYIAMANVKRIEAQVQDFETVCKQLEIDDQKKKDKETEQRMAEFFASKEFGQLDKLFFGS